jgi:hypothetical protein
MTASHQHRRRRRRLAVVAVLAAAGLLGILAVWSNALGVGDRLAGVAYRIELIVDPPPDRPIEAEVRVTPRPVPTPAGTPTPEPSPPGSADPSAPTPRPTATPKPTPERARVDVTLLRHPERWFISQVDKNSCAVAATQMVLAIHGNAPLSTAFQKELAARIGEWESRRDSRNGGWGPAAMVAALEAHGVDGYEVRAYDRRSDALRDAATAISTYHAPVLLLAWRGAHTWVMTGYRADGDPTVFDDARVTGTYILDPWYPRVSSIWGPSDPPGTFQDGAEMRRNYLPWKRPEGRYESRDGLFIALMPTVRLDR